MTKVILKLQKNVTSILTFIIFHVKFYNLSCIQVWQLCRNLIWNLKCSFSLDWYRSCIASLPVEKLVSKRAEILKQCSVCGQDHSLQRSLNFQFIFHEAKKGETLPQQNNEHFKGENYYSINTNQCVVNAFVFFCRILTKAKFYNNLFCNCWCFSICHVE